MANIQEVSGRWYGQLKDPETGKRISLPLGDSQAAAEAWKKATNQMERRFRLIRKEGHKAQQTQAGKVEGVSLGKALRTFMNFLEARVSSSTARRYKDHEHLLERLLDTRKGLQAFGLPAVDRLVKTRLKEGIDPRTIGKEQAFLRRFVRFCHERWPDAVPKDWSGSTALKPLPDGAGGPQNHRRRASRPVLSADQIKALLAALPPDSRLGARVRFLLCCPVRPCEMLRLRVADVDLEAGQLAIRIRKNGRAGGERQVTYPVVPALRQILEEAIRGKHPEAVVFPRPTGNQQQDTAGLCQEWRKWRKDHPDFQGVQLYALRRTVGTAADRTATNAIVAMGVLNHRTWAAHSCYSDLDHTDARKALEGALESLGLGA